MRQRQSVMDRMGNAIPTSIKKHKILVTFVIILLVVSIPFAVDFIKYRLSVVSTMYGDIFFDGEDIQTTNRQYITQFVDVFEDQPYMTYELGAGSYSNDITNVKPLGEEKLPIGVLVGYELYFNFDNEAATEEVLFWNFNIDLSGVRWDQVVIYDGLGSQIKVFTPAPQENNAYFFIFLFQTEIEARMSSLLIQFKGYHHDDGDFVFFTVYYSLVFSYHETDATTVPLSEDTTKKPFISSYPFLLSILPLLLIRRKKK